MNMPPLPVTGLCCLPRSFTIARMCAAIATGSPPHASLICLNDAESTLSVSTSHRISLAYARGVLSRRHARLRQRALGLDDAVRPSRQPVPSGSSEVRVVERCASCPSASTGSPPRSNGVDSTIVVRVRATPGTRLMRVRNSSRCAVERVTTLSTYDSSPATLWISSTSGNASTAAVNAS